MKKIDYSPGILSRIFQAIANDFHKDVEVTKAAAFERYRRSPESIANAKKLMSMARDAEERYVEFRRKYGNKYPHVVAPEKPSDNLEDYLPKNPFCREGQKVDYSPGILSRIFQAIADDFRKDIEATKAAALERYRRSPENIARARKLMSLDRDRYERHVEFRRKHGNKFPDIVVPEKPSDNIEDYL